MALQLNVLLVEDNDWDAKLTKTRLEKVKRVNEVMWVKDGEEALASLFGEDGQNEPQSDAIPHLILLDLKMPKIDGKEVLKEVRSRKSGKSIPIVVLSSSSRDEDIAECYELGANSYIVKPTGFDLYNETIDSITNYWLNINQVPSAV